MDIAALRAANPDHWMRAAAIRTLTLDAVHFRPVPEPGAALAAAVALAVIVRLRRARERAGAVGPVMRSRALPQPASSRR